MVKYTSLRNKLFSTVFESIIKKKKKKSVLIFRNTSTKKRYLKYHNIRGICKYRILKYHCFISDYSKISVLNNNYHFNLNSLLLKYFQFNAFENTPVPHH